MFEILTSQFRYDSLRPTDASPLLNPFVFGETETSLSGIHSFSTMSANHNEEAKGE